MAVKKRQVKANIKQEEKKKKSKKDMSASMDSRS